MKKILIVDDKKNICRVLTAILAAENYLVDSANDPLKAVEKAKKFKPDLIISDIKMPGLNGLEFYQLLLQNNLDLKLIFMTAFGSIPMAVEAIKMGASEFLTKPIDYEELKLKIRNLLFDNQSNIASHYTEKYPKIIGQSQAIIDLIEKIDLAADYSSTVLIQGESGTGKELVAQALHYHSQRATEKFVAVNCAALGRNLIESELFGHRKGAFTGAISDKKGKFEIADGGSILLDEISEIDLDIQAKLLRVLQEKEFEKVGENRTIKSDVRVIATTNQNLAEMVKNNKFREDLYYRLNVIPIFMPPLRARKEDIKLLVDFFIDKICEKEKIVKKTISQEAIDVLKQHNWPGNVRELEHVIERLIITNRSEKISALAVYNELPKSKLEAAKSGLTEKEKLIEALKIAKGNKTEAAKILAISRRTLYNWLQKYGLEEA
ncbi:sigma-54-dependent transcriptional regulator [Halanaerobium praevalens]|uniref:Stage 0 sporulation protein A homolog n=1 Tax=Halanaerobium praevalens (strain ATCC 33744 / DSM 2228 / GSL) TaxID=572479 RepID=E3DLK7_HALPG|nr:sigma-54 dependent transcriptional regulator [Halanaerobium praevalens]ADO76187.1 two component, sigma54 specific, transcriptional regulator, Fis family [Halanaerobium praevalens DSM 2228]